MGLVLQVLVRELELKQEAPISVGNEGHAVVGHEIT